MARVNLEVDSERKQRWTDHAEEHWNENLSALIRQAVEKEIATDTTRPEAPTVDLSPIEQSMQELTETVEGIERRFDRLEADEDIERIAGKISEYLPTARPGTDLWADTKTDIRTGAIPDHLPTDDPDIALNAWEGTPEGLAQATGYPPGVVDDACEHLERTINIVHLTDEGAYFKEGR